MTRLLSVGVLLALTAPLRAQQVADRDFRPPIEKAAYEKGTGPVVLFDEGHFNFHTSTGRYAPFADLLVRDGYRLRPLNSQFSAEILQTGAILVIASALNKANARNWNPPYSSAFTPTEILSMRDWVASGGALLLITDHSPFDAAVSDLAKAFDMRLLDRATLGPEAVGRRVFRRLDGTLADHALTSGLDQVATFGGCWFDVGSGGQPLLLLEGGRLGAAQGAVVPYGKGKLALFGEAAMFSAQLTGAAKAPMGMNAPIAEQNVKFVLKVMHWLSGL